MSVPELIYALAAFAIIFFCGYRTAILNMKEKAREETKQVLKIKEAKLTPVFLSAEFNVLENDHLPQWVFRELSSNMNKRLFKEIEPYITTHTFDGKIKHSITVLVQQNDRT